MLEERFHSRNFILFNFIECSSEYNVAKGGTMFYISISYIATFNTEQGIFVIFYQIVFMWIGHIHSITFKWHNLPIRRVAHSSWLSKQYRDKYNIAIVRLSIYNCGAWLYKQNEKEKKVIHILLIALLNIVKSKYSNL